MPRRTRLIAVLILLAAGAAIAALGKLDNSVTLDSAREIWSDFLRDSDEVGLHATRMSAVEEMRLGNRIAESLARWAPEDPRDTAYVAAVGARMEPFLRRRDIHYRYHVIESPQVNAFALPGGEVYVLRGMMGFLRSEAELAAVLGHEMAHVDQRHCVERFQYQRALEKVGAGSLGRDVDAMRSLAAIGYTQFQEFDADAEGQRLEAGAGYDPCAARAVFERLGRSRPPPPRAATPANEIDRAMTQALEDYFRSHPHSGERARRLFGNESRYHGQYYEGATNYRDRVSLSRYAYRIEYRRLP